MQSSRLEAACLGKLPSHGDFVRHRASTPTMRSFDEWIRKGLYRDRKRYGSGWKEAYDNAPRTRFLFRGRGRQAPNILLGVLHPSRDRSGRTYPFSVTCELPETALQGTAAYLPLQARVFYTEAEDVVDAALDGTLSHQEVTDRVSQITPEISATESPPSEYDQYTQQTLAQLVESLYGHFEDSRKYRLFKNLLDILIPQRTRSSPQLNYGLQFPLANETNTTAASVCFWLDVSRRLLQQPNGAFSFFWTPSEAGAETSFLLLFLGPPRANALFHRLTSEDPGDDVFELDQMGTENGAQAALSIPEEYGNLLEDTQLRLSDFLRQL